MSEWKVKESDEPYWVKLTDGDRYQATVKWDGCVDLIHVHNVPLPATGDHPQMVDNIHYCDLDEEIERLQALKAKAMEFFGEGWS